MTMQVDVHQCTAIKGLPQEGEFVRKSQKIPKSHNPKIALQIYRSCSLEIRSSIKLNENANHAFEAPVDGLST